MKNGFQTLLSRGFLNFSLLWDAYLQERSLVDMDNTVYQTDFLIGYIKILRSNCMATVGSCISISVQAF